MSLQEMPIVGDKIKYLGGGYRGSLTIGRVYEISKTSSNKDYAFFIDDSLDERNQTMIWDARFPYFELFEPTTSVTDLLANLALRVSELERHNREQAYEINELYKEVSR